MKVDNEDWHVGGVANDDRGKVGTAICAADDSLVAYVIHQDESGDGFRSAVDHVKGRTRSNLIAAAPELKDALEGILLGMWRGDCIADMVEARRVLSRLYGESWSPELCIAKATGKAVQP